MIVSYVAASAILHASETGSPEKDHFISDVSHEFARLPPFKPLPGINWNGQLPKKRVETSPSHGQSAS